MLSPQIEVVWIHQLFEGVETDKEKFHHDLQDLISFLEWKGSVQSKRVILSAS